MTDEEPSLFELAAAPATAEPVAAPPITADQIQKIRQAFQSAELNDQLQRKALVESVVIREVTSLRDLSALEGNRVLKRLWVNRSRAPIASEGSPWDNREDETWIDKL